MTWGQAVCGMVIGAFRNLVAVARGNEDKHGAEKEKGWDYHINGACGEVAAARVMNVFWPATINTYKKGSDVNGHQVRTRSRPDWDLIIRDDDLQKHREARFIHVVGRCPRYEVVGWYQCADVVPHKEWRQRHGDREEAWFVPRTALEPMSKINDEPAF